MTLDDQLHFFWITCAFSKVKQILTREALQKVNTSCKADNFFSFLAFIEKWSSIHDYLIAIFNLKGTG